MISHILYRYRIYSNKCKGPLEALKYDLLLTKLVVVKNVQIVKIDNLHMHKGLFNCLFEALRPGQQFFSHFETAS